MDAGDECSSEKAGKAETDKAPRYFGWMMPSVKSPPPAFDFAVGANAWPPEAVAEFEEITDFYGKFRPTVVDYSSFHDDSLVLDKLDQDIIHLFRDQGLTTFETGLRVIETHTLAERRVSSFLNSAGMFRDRLLTRATKDGKQAILESIISHIYDNSYEYRLCYNLRNRAQHHESPFYIIPIEGKDKNGLLEFEIELELSRDRLLTTSKKMQPRVRAELSEGPEKIPLLPLCRAYRKEIARIFAFALFLQRDQFARAFFYEQAVRRAHPEMPNNATPLMFNGKPTGNFPEQMTCNVTSFSFDELARIQELLRDAEPDASLTELFAAAVGAQPQANAKVQTEKSPPK